MKTRNQAIATGWTVWLLAVVAAVPACATRSYRRVAIDGPPNAGEPRRVVPEGAVERLLKAHNAARSEKKLPKLVLSKKLTSAAEGHARDMADRRKMEHQGGDGSTPAERIKKQGYNFRRAAENVAFGQFDLDQLMDGWMNSPGHRRNILGAYSQVGIAYATDKDGIPYWCVNFGTPLR